MICEKCGHEHAGRELAHICIGCPCDVRPAPAASLDAADRLHRYDLITNYRCGSSIEEMERSEDGDWVRYEDIAPFLKENRDEVRAMPERERRGDDHEAGPRECESGSRGLSRGVEMPGLRRDVAASQAAEAVAPDAADRLLELPTHAEVDRMLRDAFQFTGSGYVTRLMWHRLIDAVRETILRARSLHRDGPAAALEVPARPAIESTDPAAEGSPSDKEI